MTLGLQAVYDNPRSKVTGDVRKYPFPNAVLARLAIDLSSDENVVNTPAKGNNQGHQHFFLGARIIGRTPASFPRTRGFEALQD